MNKYIYRRNTIEALGHLGFLVGLITIGVWVFKYASVKLKKRVELNQTEQWLGYIGLGVMLLGMFIGEPTWRMFGGTLIFGGFVLVAIFIIHVIMNKLVTKSPVKSSAKIVGAAAAIIMLLGSVIEAPYAEADRKERDAAAKIAKAKSESEAMVEAEKKAKEASEAKVKSESKAKEESKKQKKKDAEAKAKSESEAKVREEKEAQAKAAAAEKSKLESQESAKAKVAEQQTVAQAPVTTPTAPTGTTEGVTGVIIGNVKSGIYHVPGQRHYNTMTNKNKIYFNSEQEAQAAGFRRSKS